jgi:hypothetical protein
LIDVAPIQMIGTSQVIQFIPKNSVTVGCQQVQQEFRERNVQHDRRARDKAVGVSIGRGVLSHRPCRNSLVRRIDISCQAEAECQER